jgi:hypothetical protein
MSFKPAGDIIKGHLGIIQYGYSMIGEIDRWREIITELGYIHGFSFDMSELGYSKLQYQENKKLFKNHRDAVYARLVL